MTAIALALTLLAAPPPPGVPRLIDAGSVSIDSRWKKVKELTDPAEQRRLVERDKLLRRRCDDVVSFVELLRNVDLPYRYRDTVRWRTDARPELVALLAEAGRRLRRKLPHTTITVGDMAQQGCGQIQYGTLVDFVPKAEAVGLQKRADAYFGEQGFIETVPPEAYMDEYPRFEEDGGPLWVERRLTGKLASGAVRVETRRFDSGKELRATSVVRLLERTSQRLQKRRSVAWDRVVHRGPDGELHKLRRATWHDSGQQRFAEVVFRPGKGPTRSLRAEDVLRIREGRIDLRKPLSIKYEERYRFGWDGEAGAVVRRHMLLYEAHHASHLAGFDVDLSYATWENGNHFVPDASQLDPQKSWIWLKILDTTARSLGIPIQAMFVDKSILAVLRRAPAARRKDPLWRKLRRSSGHDSHVHLRVGAAPRYAGKSVAQILRDLKMGPRPKRADKKHRKGRARKRE